MKCPKCGYQRQPGDEAPVWQCPSCFVAYAKVNHLAPPTQASVARSVATSTSRLSNTAEESDAADDSERHSLAASGQKIVIYCIAANFVLRAADQSHALTPLVMQLLYVVAGIFSLIGIARICSGLQKSQGAKIAFMTLSFWPLLNVIALIYLSAKTNRMLRDAGWRVGLFGAKP